MDDIDIGYAVFVWQTDLAGCFFCALMNTNELCPKDCHKNGSYRSIMEHELEWYHRCKGLKEWVEKKEKNKEELKKRED